MSGGFGGFVARSRAAGRLVVPPRMGMGDPARMRTGLLATKHANATAVGTVTLDSYTRVGADTDARRAVAEGIPLNGYPIVAHGPATTRAMLRGVRDGGFPVQVRHGSARPQRIFAALLRSGLDATEGGPVSYCLPYGRVPLRESVDNWARCCDMLAGAGQRAHLETFGGCLMGQLCPPSLLVATSVLEAMFFRQHGLRSVSLSYAQQTHPVQDEEAVAALRALAGEFLAGVDWHVVIYTYMGVYPRTPDGARRLLEASARLAVRTGAERLIVKTVAEAHRIPTVAENVAALEDAAAAAAREHRIPASAPPQRAGIYAEARALVLATLDLEADIGRALLRAFARGYLDVPYCLHPDNAGRTRSRLGPDGRLGWAAIGSLPLGGLVEAGAPGEVTAAGLLTSLSYVEHKFDRSTITQPRKVAVSSWSSAAATGYRAVPGSTCPPRPPARCCGSSTGC